MPSSIGVVDVATAKNQRSPVGKSARRAVAPITAASSAVEEQVEDLDEADIPIPVNYTITSYGADYPVDSLITRMRSGDIIVPRFNWIPDEGGEIVGFQREYVWPRPKADKFIESLLLGLPVPGIFLVKEATGRLLVLDGHQRLYTLSAFYKGVIHGQEYSLDSVQKRFEGIKYADLDTEDRRRLDDSIIHATIVRQDQPTNDQSSIYVIFERLNTGGVNLQPQEIRVALYHGELVGVLRELNENATWRQLYGATSKRLKDMELILRFFAFFYYAKSYAAPMKDFLNKYMATNRHLEHQSREDLKSIFSDTIALISKAIGQKAFRPQRAINAAVMDSLMTGIALRIAKGRVRSNTDVRRAYESLMSDPLYVRAIETGTSQDANVATRLRLSAKAFARVK